MAGSLEASFPNQRTSICQQTCINDPRGKCQKEHQTCWLILGRSSQIICDPYSFTPPSPGKPNPGKPWLGPPRCQATMPRPRACSVFAQPPVAAVRAGPCTCCAAATFQASFSPTALLRLLLRVTNPRLLLPVFQKKIVPRTQDFCHLLLGNPVSKSGNRPRKSTYFSQHSSAPAGASLHGSAHPALSSKREGSHGEAEGKLRPGRTLLGRSPPHFHHKRQDLQATGS